MVMIVLALVVAGILAAFTALYLWTRRMERDVDYADLHNDDDNERLRNTAQLAIGLSSTQQTYQG